MISSLKYTKEASISVFCIHSQISSLMVYFALIYKKGSHNITQAGLDQAGCFELTVSPRLALSPLYCLCSLLTWDSSSSASSVLGQEYSHPCPPAASDLSFRFISFPIHRRQLQCPEYPMPFTVVNHESQGLIPRVSQLCLEASLRPSSCCLICLISLSSIVSMTVVPVPEAELMSSMPHTRKCEAGAWSCLLDVAV